jgi:hypothetical protein
MKIDASGNYSVMYTFPGGTGGGGPSPAPTLDPEAGGLFGVTSGGGLRRDGVVYRLRGFFSGILAP